MTKAVGSAGPLGNRRRAERFAQLLEEAAGRRRQHRHSPLDQDLVELVGLRHRLVAMPAPGIDPEFRAGLRAMLVATAEREGIGITAQTEEPTGRTFAFPRGPRARTAVVTGVAVGAVAFAGMSAASDSAMPGDPLYGVKRSTERAQLALASSDVGRGYLHLGFAQARLAEARMLEGTGGVARVLDDMDQNTSQGVRLLTTAAAGQQDRSALDVIDEFVAGQRHQLRALAREVGDADVARIDDSLILLDSVATRALELRRGLEDHCPAAEYDALGPRPSECVSLSPPSPIELTPEATTPAGGTQPNPGAEPEQPPAENERQPLIPPVETPVPLDGEAPAEPAPAEPADENQSSNDSGLFGGINRLLGDLLGG
jgi:hypothetical protein